MPPPIPRYHTLDFFGMVISVCKQNTFGIDDNLKILVNCLKRGNTYLTIIHDQPVN